MPDSLSSFHQSSPDSPPRASSPSGGDLKARSPRSQPGLQPQFKVLIALTLLTALLLLPFALSPLYLNFLRSRSVDLHFWMRGELYKQITGFSSLFFVLLELVLTARKRGRTWPMRLKVPGSIRLWRNVHIFSGVALVGLVLIHTLGSTGLNFNALFLWVFFGVTLTALMGVVAETGILESSRSYFGRWPGLSRPLTKGPLIRGLRSLWLTSHIFLVSLFMVMLVIHILLAYYYQ
ncbi:hypothetical protein [Lyngbya confervoides]|uniref:Ferric oxidoreductase domain-containing protein n=1 Tax=Lyngbya confervoides BDU141951 TaxID=1574623 RepID=A0ABD4T2M0_9CYAN|nr:hypothetical protein [Lyngbya confervoides]MCM1982600.1 hypothetical protein [Lyngbya confervoides BDU141951]